MEEEILEGEEEEYVREEFGAIMGSRVAYLNRKWGGQNGKKNQLFLRMFICIRGRIWERRKFIGCATATPR